MTRAAVCLSALASLAVPVVGAQSSRLSEEATSRHTLRFGGTGERSVTVRNLNGSIRVDGADAGDVQVEARQTVRANTRDGLAQGRQAVSLSTVDERPDVQIVVHDPEAPVCGERSRNGRRRTVPYDVQYDIAVRVPVNTRLVLCTVNGAVIAVRGTSGNFEIDNVNGRVELRDVRGDGTVQTVNGGIEAVFLAAPRQPSTFRTVNGDVSITWPGDLSADLRLKTMHGGVFTDFDVRGLPVEPAAGSRRDGRFVYRSNGAAGVRVGQGGPVISLETVNGDVRVLRAGR